MYWHRVSTLMVVEILDERVEVIWETEGRAERLGHHKMAVFQMLLLLLSLQTRNRLHLS